MNMPRLQPCCCKCAICASASGSTKRPAFEAVKGISFDVPRNATVALVGESGSGKSVSSLAVMGLLPTENSASSTRPASIEFEGRDLLELSLAERRKMCGKEISMIFQEPMSSLNPVFTVGFQIGEVLRLHMGMNAQAGARAHDRAAGRSRHSRPGSARSTPIRARCRAASSSA